MPDPREPRGWVVVARANPPRAGGRHPGAGRSQAAGALPGRGRDACGAIRHCARPGDCSSAVHGVPRPDQRAAARVRKAMPPALATVPGHCVGAGIVRGAAAGRRRTRTRAHSRLLGAGSLPAGMAAPGPLPPPPRMHGAQAECGAPFPNAQMPAGPAPRMARPAPHPARRAGRPRARHTRDNAKLRIAAYLSEKDDEATQNEISQKSSLWRQGDGELESLLEEMIQAGWITSKYTLLDGGMTAYALADAGREALAIALDLLRQKRPLSSLDAFDGLVA